jgi:hypothetical protein
MTTSILNEDAPEGNSPKAAKQIREWHPNIWAAAMLMYEVYAAKGRLDAGVDNVRAFLTDVGVKLTRGEVIDGLEARMSQRGSSIRLPARESTETSTSRSTASPEGVDDPSAA